MLEVGTTGMQRWGLLSQAHPESQAEVLRGPGFERCNQGSRDGEVDILGRGNSLCKVRGGSKTQKYTSKVRRFLLARSGAGWEVRA